MGPIAAGEPDQDDIVLPAAKRFLGNTALTGPETLTPFLAKAPSKRKGHERPANLCWKAEAAPADRTARIEPFIHDKVLILSLLLAIFRAVSLQRDLERAVLHRLGSRPRSITNAFGENPP
jgi:hypothetical protein